MKRLYLSSLLICVSAVVFSLVLTSAGRRSPEKGELRTSQYVYTGGVADGKQHGFGICRYKNGNVYTGYWNMGYKEGLGRIEFADGTMDFGKWRQGILKAPEGRKFRVGERCYGIDVSKYQETVDWTVLSLPARANGTVALNRKKAPYLQPVLFGIVKSTEGSDLRDPYFNQNFPAVKEAGLLRGAYHFLTVYSPAADQAKFFIENTPLEKGDFPPVLDLEIKHDIMRKQYKLVRKMALEWLKIIEEHYGVTPIVYTYENYYKDYLKGHGFDKYDFWIAHFYQEPTARRWEIWQITEKGSCTGVRGKVDVDRFRGSYADLKKYLQTNGIQ